MNDLRNPSEREDGNPRAPRRNLEQLLHEAKRRSNHVEQEEKQPGAAHYGAGEDQQHLVEPQGRKGRQIKGGEGAEIHLSPNAFSAPILHLTGHCHQRIMFILIIWVEFG